MVEAKLEITNRLGLHARAAAKLEDFLAFVLPRYRRENRSYLSVAIGCTGGRHRSVAVCELLAGRLRNSVWRVRASHRDIDR